MATKKSAGVSKNGRDSNPKYLGVKLNHGATAKVGSIIVRQRGTVIMAGENVGVGKDHTLFALKAGKIEIKDKRKKNFDSTITTRKIAHVR